MAVVVGGTVHDDDGFLGVEREVQDLAPNELFEGDFVVAVPRDGVPESCLLAGDHTLKLHSRLRIRHVWHHIHLELVLGPEPGLPLRLPGVCGGLVDVEDLNPILEVVKQQ